MSEAMWYANYSEARPRTAEEIASLPYCPEVAVAAEQRGVTQVVHFTTVSGVVGMLASGAVKNRSDLANDEFVKFVYRPNSSTRRDLPWLGYVNLSIERINDWMFDRSWRWHSASGAQWATLSFTPQILAHPGVVFTTTNNMYRDCRRAEGLAGFSQMFAESLSGWEPWRQCTILHNRIDKQPSWPTNRQAEVLYPSELSCEYLQRIEVQNEGSVDTIHGILGGLGLSISVRHAPEVFR